MGDNAVTEALLKMSSSEFNGTEATEEVNHIFADTLKEQMEAVPETYIEKTLKIDLVKEKNKWYILEITDEMLDVVMAGFTSLSTELEGSFEETETLDEDQQRNLLLRLL